jgi:hypothetical protein
MIILVLYLPIQALQYDPDNAASKSYLSKAIVRLKEQQQNNQQQQQQST